MREKVAQWLSMSEKYGNFSVWDSLPNDTQENYRSRADRLIGLQCAEIEKVENPQPHDSPYLEIQCEYIGFEDCRQKILALLRK